VHFSKNRFFKLLFILALLGSSPAIALLVIPTKLSAQDEGKILNILGYGTACKILGDPYPLGGYSGVEIGLEENILQTDQISSLGSGAAQQGQTTYNTLTLGKGIYNNIDTIVQFAFLGQTENVSNFGGQVRWGFYQAEYLPIYLSTVAHWDSTNFANLVTTTTMGGDLIMGVHEGDVTLYLGAGIIRSMGSFAGGTGAITASGNTEQNGIEDNRFIVGLNFKIQKAYLAGEMDQTRLPTYAAKLGFRF